MSAFRYLKQNWFGNTKRLEWLMNKAQRFHLEFIFRALLTGIKKDFIPPRL